MFDFDFLALAITVAGMKCSGLRATNLSNSTKLNARQYAGIHTAPAIFYTRCYMPLFIDYQSFKNKLYD